MLPTITEILKFLDSNPPYIGGYYNDNYILEINNKKFLLRMPKTNAQVMDIKLIDELSILQFTNQLRLNSPTILTEYNIGNTIAYLHEFLEGNTIESLYPGISIIDNWIVLQLSKEISHIHRNSKTANDLFAKSMPWKLTNCELYTYIFNFNINLIFKCISKYPRFFKELDFPTILECVLVNKVDQIQDANFCLCHADIHRKNVIIDKSSRVIKLIDWELAIIATPEYDISIHMHKMRYSPIQEANFLKTYCNLSNLEYESFTRQVDLYRELEEIKSAYIDAIRYLSDIVNTNISDDAVSNLSVRYYSKLIKAYKRWGINSDISANDIFEKFKEFK